MKPERFSLLRPRTLTEALEALATQQEGAKVIAGGQSLGPMLNLRLVAPRTLIDISALPELHRADVDTNGIHLGACVTHADLEDGRTPDLAGGVLRRIACGIAYRAVRNRGTIGGSLAHADPAADWVTTLMALDARVEIATADARRTLRLRDFISGALTTRLAATDLLVAVHIPHLASTARFGYVKTCRKIGEFSHASAAILHNLQDAHTRYVIGAVETCPIVIDETGLLPDAIDESKIEELLVRAGRHDPIDRHLHLEVARRAFRQVQSEART